MAYNPYATATPSQTTGQYCANPFVYDEIPSDLINKITLDPDAKLCVIEREEGNSEYTIVEDASALILDFYAVVETALDNHDPTAVDVFFQSHIDNGGLAPV